VGDAPRNQYRSVILDSAAVKQQLAFLEENGSQGIEWFYGSVGSSKGQYPLRLNLLLMGTLRRDDLQSIKYWTSASKWTLFLSQILETYEEH
jgi:hypothetical protein